MINLKNLLIIAFVLIIGLNAVFIPKKNLIDLHCHLDGSFTPEIVKKLAKLQNIKLPTDDDEKLYNLIVAPKSCKSLVEFLQRFEIPSLLTQTLEGIEESVYLVQENIRSQGIVYAEIRFAPQLHTLKGLTQEQVIKAAIKGLKKSPLHCNLILCLIRNKDNQKQNLETIELAKKYLVKDQGVVAIDLAGAEGLFKTYLFEEEFKLARDYGIPYTIHAGEADGPPVDAHP